MFSFTEAYTILDYLLLSLYSYKLAPIHPKKEKKNHSLSDLGRHLKVQSRVKQEVLVLPITSQ